MSQSSVRAKELIDEFEREKKEKDETSKSLAGLNEQMISLELQLQVELTNHTQTIRFLKI